MNDAAADPALARFLRAASATAAEGDRPETLRNQWIEALRTAAASLPDINAGGVGGEGAAHHLVRARPQEALRFFAAARKMNLDFNRPDHRGRTPFHVFAAVGARDPQATARWLTRTAGADPCASDEDGMTPLHAAAATRDHARVKALLDAGAARVRNAVAFPDRWTPLHVAARWSDDEVVTLLLAVGADARLTTRPSGGSKGRSAYALARANRKIGHEALLRLRKGARRTR